MGCCYSFFCNDDSSSQAGEPTERTHLLVNPVSINTTVVHANSEDYIFRNANTLPKKTDEQSALNRILQETATNVIDVAALDSHNLQHHEYLERMKHYNVKVQQVMGNNRNALSYKVKLSLLQDIPMPEKVMMSEPINPEDIKLINSFLSSAVASIQDIKVEHKENLVEPFGINC
ncbi:unnamed protein product [Brassicogethes aeneus]|uniref:Ragulator complex protein LAMTOR1 n=1 Tax=Brassicogethes aeneus TaxID=1431903 RepID=A0A9P0FG42_BRAAE|nr:unnamed protein product [Brassicogethes aeneus]